MLTRTYTLCFVTPAFLGNAEQDGQWRTPPIKALLRQWWRVAYAADHRHAPDLRAMREAEGRLFGVAADSGGGSNRSRVRVRLGRWDIGTLKKWEGLEQPPVRHPETEKTGYKVGPHAYLGYGPLDGRGGTKFSDKVRAAIQAGEAGTLSIAFPADNEAERVETAVTLLHHYGTLGGRSRNGWGSFALVAADAATPRLDAPLDQRLTRPWRDALSIDWPHSIGSDGRPLIWRTEPLADWKTVMAELARLKIGLRTQKAFEFINGAADPQARHWLSYPVTHHNFTAWRERGRGDFRLPNSLRFKVRVDADNKLRGVIFHVPCLPPPQFRPDRAAIERVWQQVHRFLDHPEQRLQRIAA
jgi:CRISPR-associated protein Cmr1